MNDDAITKAIIKVETLRISISMGRQFLAMVPKGADPKLEARVDAEKVELEQAKRELEELEAA
jgi:hypothetical protein